MPSEIDERVKRTSKINTWKPKKNQVMVEPDGKLFICHFDKITNCDKFKVYNRFIINKGSYENQLGIICKYTNFFMTVYDLDNELGYAYLKLKYSLDHEKKSDGSSLYGPEEMNAFIDLIYEIMFTPTMVEKIERMVEDNYLDDIETTTEEKKKYLKNDKKHLESLEFTNLHIKILLRISFGMKIMSPVLFHYLSLNLIKIEKDSEIIFRFYQKLFDLFGYGPDYELVDNNEKLFRSDITQEEIKELVDSNTVVPVSDKYQTIYRTETVCDDDGNSVALNGTPYTRFYRHTKIMMYNKLYVYVKAKVLESNNNNAPIFEQRKIFGIDVFTVVNQFTKKVLISENMVKYKFNENYDTKLHKYRENVIGFNKTIIKFQLNYFLKDQYTKNLTEVTNTKNADGLSGIDKMSMNLQKLDEGTISLVDINIKTTIDRIRRIIDVPITEEEIDYYAEHMHPSELQIQFVYSYFTKFFASYRDLNLVTRRDYIILVLTLKKKLLIDFGYDETEDGEIHQAVLPYILSGNLENRVNTRIIRNNKFISKITDSYIYKNLLNEKYAYLQEIKKEYIESQLSTFINTRFSYVTYETPEMTGEMIEYSEDKISDEILFFLNTI